MIIIIILIFGYLGFRLLATIFGLGMYCITKPLEILENNEKDKKEKHITDLPITLNIPLNSTDVDKISNIISDIKSVKKVDIMINTKVDKYTILIIAEPNKGVIIEIYNIREKIYSKTLNNIYETISFIYENTLHVFNIQKI